jgi:predicted DCC family thiol-disulfide oxidoreductase YuxK
MVPPSASAHGPAPEAAPVAELTVLYDGNCALCRASAERLRRHDRGHRIELLDLHDPSVPSRFPQVDHEKALRLMQAVDGDGRVSSGIDAWAEVAQTLPGWRVAAWVLHTPGVHALAGWVYAWVARNRYRWNREACADGSCALHGHPSENR